MAALTWCSKPAIQNYGEQLQIVPDNMYRLKAGDYQLTVKSDDVTVFSDTIRVNSDGGLVVPEYEVKP